MRSANELIPWHSDEEQGFSIQGIREWGIAEEAAGRPGTMAEFYAAHGLCLDCLASGAQMVGWSNPMNEIDIQAAEELGLSQLPLYAVRPICAVLARPKGHGGAGDLHTKTHYQI